jgi:hypothetical protein
MPTYFAAASTAPSAMCVAVCRGALVALFALLAANPHASVAGSVHGLWAWKGPSLIADSRGSEALLQFCRAQHVTEVYLSVSEHDDLSALAQFGPLIDAMHRSAIRVEALISSTDADEAGKHRDKLLDHVRAVVQFNRAHPATRFDGIHLDIEPQQRPENKGVGNLRFLPGLADAYRAVRTLAESAQMSVNADIQVKLLKGSLAERRLLLSSLPRLTLMLYELSSPTDADTSAQKMARVQQVSQQDLQIAYDGLQDPNLARMAIGLRTPDYGDLLPDMLTSLDQANRTNTHYLGWARHAYNDILQ